MKEVNCLHFYNDSRKEDALMVIIQPITMPRVLGEWGGRERVVIECVNVCLAECMYGFAYECVYYSLLSPFSQIVSIISVGTIFKKRVLKNSTHIVHVNQLISTTELFHI